MLTGQIIDSLPISVVYILTVLALLFAMEVGYRLNKSLARKTGTPKDEGLGPIIGATLALLAFSLAFVVSFSANIFNDRRLLVIDEANAIGTTYLRAGYLDEPQRSKARDLLRVYIGLRIDLLESEKREDALARSEQIHSDLWEGAEQIARESPSEPTALYISALNDVIDLHNERISVGLGIRVPPTVLLGLYLVALGTMFLVGLQSALVERRNLIALLVLVLILAVVFLLIVDLDRSQDGLLKVPHYALYKLQRQLNGSP